MSYRTEKIIEELLKQYLLCFLLMNGSSHGKKAPSVYLVI